MACYTRNDAAPLDASGSAPRLHGNTVMPWYRLELGPADFADNERISVSKAVEQAWHDAGRPAGLTAYYRHESEGRLHCTLVVYFHPTAEAVAKRLGARPCPDPGPWDLGHLAGASEER